MSVQSGKKDIYSQSIGSTHGGQLLNSSTAFALTYAKPEIRTIRPHSSSEVLAAVAGELQSKTAA